MSSDILPEAHPFSFTGGSDGVLVLHGYTSNPASMRPMAERLASAGFTVELPRLPGHGTSVEDLMDHAWTDFATAALAAFDGLAARCERVAIVGLSLGGGLGAYVAEERPDVAAIVFINAWVKPFAREMLEGLDALLEAGLETIDGVGGDVKRAGAVESSYRATPLASAKTVMAGLAPVHERLSSIAAPSLVFSSREDHVITSDNSDDLEAMLSGPVERIWLEDSYHVATLDNDQEFIEHTTVTFLQRCLAR